MILCLLIVSRIRTKKKKKKTLEKLENTRGKLRAPNVTPNVVLFINVPIHTSKWRCHIGVKRYYHTI